MEFYSHKARASTNRGVWCKQIPVTPGTTVRISVQVKTSEVPSWGTKANVISRFYPSGTSETDNGPAFGNINGLNTTVYARPSGVLYHAAGMSTNKVNVPVVETEGVWYDVTYEVDVPEGAALLKVALNSDWINATQQWNFRRLTVVAYQKGPQGDKGDKGDPGGTGPQGPAGVDALPIFSGYVTNEAIILSATNSGAVSDFSKATGTFVTHLGQDQLTSGVTYSRVSQSGVTATINTTTGAYSVTAASADTGMVVFKAIYQGIEIQKIVSVTKAKQGAGGKQGEPGPQGDGSYLHVAWKMADGTFTVSYPQENLFSETVGRTYKPHPLNTTIMYVPVPATVGKKYTAQSNRAYSGSTTSVWFINNLDALPASNVNGIGMQGTTPITRTVTATTSFVYLVFRTVSVLSEFLNGSKPSKAKVEQGDTATVYTEAPSDDYTLAYPKYRGEYTDTVKADSTDPTKYTWTAYLGEQGPPTGVISQSTVPSSPYVGMLWQCTGNIAGYINPATYRWNGSAWEIYQFTAQNIMADTFTGFTFQGVKMIASEFISHQEFDRVIQPAPESIIENHVTDISIADGRLLIETNVDTIHDLSAGVKWTDQVHMETTVDDTLGFIIDGTRRWGQDGTTTYSALVQNSEFIALLPNSRDAMSEKDMVTNNNWRNVVATKHCGRQLWDGGQYMTSNQVVTPMAKLSDCLNGWLLQWQRYNPGVGLDNSRYFYQPIAKGHPSGKGITTYISAPASATNNGGVPAATKYVYVTDTTITGYDANSVSPGNNWALSGVFGW